jgi:hypothetical protein
MKRERAVRAVKDSFVSILLIGGVELFRVRLLAAEPA